MTYVPVLGKEGSYPIAVGAPGDIYAGRSVFVSRGFDLDPTMMRGYRRSPGRETTMRPGAHTPPTDRTSVGIDRSWWVGTQNERDSLAKMRQQWEESGPVGTRHAYETPPPAGLNRKSRMPLSGTPAMGVFKSAMAATGGMMKLGGSFTNLGLLAPGDSVPPGLNPWMPLPPGPAPVQSVAQAPTPVGCLPGTPGCYSGPGDQVPPGLRMPWGATQNQGQYQTLQTSPPPSASPLPGAGNTVDPYLLLPTLTPGTEHVTQEGGDVSYTERPSYPTYLSPFGYQGSDRIANDASIVSADDSDLASFFKRNKLAAVVAAVAAGGIVLSIFGKRRKKRRAS